MEAARCYETLIFYHRPKDHDQIILRRENLKSCVKYVGHSLEVSRPRHVYEQYPNEEFADMF
jgi:hypothetical protein